MDAAVHGWIPGETAGAGSWTIVVVVGIVVLGALWFALRFWLGMTRPPKIREIETPRLDRLNREALEAMGRGEEDGEEEAPDGLKGVVPKEPEKEQR